MKKALQKGISMLLCFALLVACMISGSVTATADAAETEADTELIYTADELLAAVTSTTKTYYKLANDIVINDITVKIENGVGVVYNAEGTEPLDDAALAELKSWNTSNKKFAGTIDGDGHVVRGLYFKGEVSEDQRTDNDTYDFRYACALISNAADGAAVKNLGLEDAYVSYEHGTASGIIGNMNSAAVTVENCYVGDSAYFYGHNSSAILGSGSPASGTTTLVKNCYSQATVAVMNGTINSTYKAGAVFADAWNWDRFTLENVYATNSFRYSGTTIGINCSQNLSAEEGNIGTFFEGNTLSLGNAFAAVDGKLPTLKVFKGLSEDVWGGLSDNTLDGSGTESDPYIISSGEELAYMASKKGAIDSTNTIEHYKLSGNIYLNDVFKDNWESAAYNNMWLTGKNADRFVNFSLDGDGYCIYGLWYPADADKVGTDANAGLFPVIAQGVTVKNLGIKESQIWAQLCAGAFAGRYFPAKNTTDAAANFTNCFADASVSVIQETSGASASGAGGFLGSAWYGTEAGYLSFENCYSAATISSEKSNSQRANGFIGNAYNCFYKATNIYSIGAKPWYAATDGTRSKFAASAETDLAKAYNGVYSNSSAVGSTQLSAANMKGAAALENMVGFSGDTWYAVQDDTKTPMLRIHGMAIADIDENGIGFEDADILALRSYLVSDGNDTPKNGNYNRDEDVNILDLVAVVIAQ